MKKTGAPLEEGGGGVVKLKGVHNCKCRPNSKGTGVKIPVYDKCSTSRIDTTQVDLHVDPK